MNPHNRHVLERLDNLEAELSELREVTWPVCQGIIDEKDGQFQNMKQKRRFFMCLDIDEIKKHLNFKSKFMGTSRDLVHEELRQVLVETPRESS